MSKTSNLLSAESIDFPELGIGKVNILSAGSYLKIPSLPHGIINKSETGIGGTTVETNAKRHSIIVEPLKSIASSKAANNKDFLYVGSPTNLHKTPTDDDILCYHRSNIDYKKIFVVADSLPRVIKAIGEEVFKIYFLLIDEIDSFQEDSSFRGNIEKCIDYYLNFPKTQRALISATLNTFSNPGLKDEIVTTYQYDTPTRRNIDLVLSNSVERSALLKIVNKFESGEKIVVAYNSLTQILAIIDSLKKESTVKDEDIGILCGEGSKGIAERFYREFEDNLLPSKITFKTAAYFSGIDIKERYHLISIASTKIPYTILSVNKFRQIAGRCRVPEKLFSETIIFSKHLEPMDMLGETAEEHIKIAEKYLNIFNCIKVLNGEQTQKKYAELKQKIYETLGGEKADALLRIDFNDNYAISYFKIDRLLEIYDTQRMYSVVELRETLDKDNDVNKSEEYFAEEEIDASLDHQELKSQQIQEAIDTLSGLDIKSFDLNKLIKDRRIFKYEISVYEQYKDLVGYVDHISFVECLSKMDLPSKPNFRDLNNLVKILWFQTLSPNSKIRQRITEQFQVGNRYLPGDIIYKMKSIFEEKESRKNYSPKSAVALFNLLFTTKRAKIQTKRGLINGWEITEEALPDVKILKYRETFDPSFILY